MKGNGAIVGLIVLFIIVLAMSQPGFELVPGSLYDNVHAEVYGTCDGLLPQVWEYRTKVSEGSLVYIFSGIMNQPDTDHPINVIQTSTTIDVIFCDNDRMVGNCVSHPLSTFAAWEDKVINIEIDQGDCSSVPPVTDTCYDGMLNQDETGIDCGGVCQSCNIIVPNIFEQFISFIQGILETLFGWLR